MSFPFYLTILIFSPVLGFIALMFIPKTAHEKIKRVGLFATLPPLLLAIIYLFVYQFSDDKTIFNGSVSWLQFFQLKGTIAKPYTIIYELAVDGFSLVMILLTALIVTIAAVAGRDLSKQVKGFFLLFLILEIGMLGVFAADNLLLFFIFFEITLVPVFFLIGKWGFFEKERAAFSYLIYNGVGSAILLIVIIVLFAKTGTTNIDQLREIMTISSSNLTPTFKSSLLIALIIAFGVKLPIFPLHSWMLKVHVQAPYALVIIHSAILLKIGAYGLIKFGMGIFPEQFAQIATILAIFGVINLLYGALLAFVQTDFRLVLAYSSVSHMGIVLIGLASLTEVGIQGAMFQAVSHGLISALLFFIIGIIYGRTATTELPNLSGLAKGMPLASGFLMAGAMASLGLPGTSGFISEFMAFLGLFKELPIIAAIGVIGIIITAVYLLRAVLAVTYGQASRQFANNVDLTKSEIIPAAILTTMIILIGVYPKILSEPLQVTLKTIMLGIGG